jgi:hypothetical protein
MRVLLANDYQKMHGLDRPGAREVRRHLHLLWRWEVVRDAAKARGGQVSEATKEFVALCRASGERVSAKSLYIWRRAYQADGWKGLLDQRRRAERPSPADAGFLAELERQYRRSFRWLGRPVSVAYRTSLCHHAATQQARRRGWRPCTLREAVRFIRAKVLPALQGESGGADAA